MAIERPNRLVVLSVNRQFVGTDLEDLQDGVHSELILDVFFIVIHFIWIWLIIVYIWNRFWLIYFNVSTRFVLPQLASNIEVILGNEFIDVDGYVVRLMLDIAQGLVLVLKLLEIRVILYEDHHSWLNFLI